MKIVIKSSCLTKRKKFLKQIYSFEILTVWYSWYLYKIISKLNIKD